MPSKKERKHLIEAQRQAREQFARYLHDGPAQSVAAAAMRLGIARRFIEKDATAVDKELDGAEEQIRQASKEMRYLLLILQAQGLKSYGLITALEELAEQTGETFSQQVHLEADLKLVQVIDAERQEVFFYIAVEGVALARRHADVETIWLRLNQVEKDLILLEVQDNGAGFDSREIESANLPLDEAPSRALHDLLALVEGKMGLEDKEGGSAPLQLWLPLNEKAAARLRDGE